MTSDRLVAEGKDTSREGGGLLAQLFVASALLQVTPVRYHSFVNQLHLLVL